MTAVALSPVFLSFLLLAAHFYRSQNLLLAGVSLAFLVLLVLRRPWVVRVLQVALVLGALEWLRTLAMLVMERTAMGQPYWRLALILGTVAGLTALSGLVFRSARLRGCFTIASAASR